jgi:hypothetical protein
MPAGQEWPTPDRRYLSPPRARPGKSRRLQQFPHGPNVICNPGSHRGRHAQRPVDATEVVERHPNHYGRAVILKLLTEGVRQARESADAHSDAEILALNVGRADTFGIGLSDAWDNLRRNHVCGGVAVFTLGASAIDLDELREVYPKPERNKPWKFMHRTVDQVYRPLARSNGKILELTNAQRENSEARWKRLHQFLSEIGVKALRTHLGQLLGIARISGTKDQYEKHFNVFFGDQYDSF